MATLHQVIVGFTAHAPTGLQEIRDALATVTFDQEPVLVDIQALGVTLRPLLPVSHRGALDRILVFAANEGQLSFSHFRRLTVALQLIQRLIWPEIVQQKSTEFCGPTAFVINFCRTQPLAWSDLAANLAERGTARVGSLDLAPGSGVRGRESTNIAHMAEADWILIASLRDTVSTDAAHLAGSWIFRKSFEEVGVAWESIRDWNIQAGFSSVVSLGNFNTSNWTADFYQRPGARFPRLAMKYKALHGICNPDQRAINMLLFASEACGNDWAVFFLVDDKLGRAINGAAMADAQWQQDIRASRGQLGAVADPQLTKGFYQGVNRTLAGADVGGHVFLLLSLEIGGMYVSLTGINRGKLVTADLLPKASFTQAVRGIIAASDSA
jgi:hypothetical protein